jgi:hypothetical protein
MKKTTLSLLSILTLFLFSCQKESSNNEQKSENELTGTWNLLHLDMEGENSIEVSSDDLGSIKNIVFMDYLTTNNKGSITFEESKLASNNLSYDVTGTFSVKQYMDNLLVNSYDSAINIAMPPSSSTTDYVRISADSIYCPNGAFINVEGADGLESKPAGIKYKVDGDRLIMTIKQKESEVLTEEGITQETNSNVTCVVTLQKQ